MLTIDELRARFIELAIISDEMETLSRKLKTKAAVAKSDYLRALGRDTIALESNAIPIVKEITELD